MGVDKRNELAKSSRDLLRVSFFPPKVKNIGYLKTIVQTLSPGPHPLFYLGLPIFKLSGNEDGRSGHWSQHCEGAFKLGKSKHSSS